MTKDHSICFPGSRRNTYQDQELKGEISYSFLEGLINSETREFNIRKTPDKRFILRMGDNHGVERGEGINYLHFHPDECGIKKINGTFIRKEFEGLPSVNDIDIMLVEGQPHMVISKQGISVYSNAKDILSNYSSLLKESRGFLDMCSLIFYESSNYDIFRSLMKNEPMKIRMYDALIEYLPWKQTNLQEHDFREVPKLEISHPELIVAEFLLKKL